jgi:hypothetical protein
MRRNHRYRWIIVPHPKKDLADAGVGQPIEICKRCFTVRECIGTVGLYRRIRSYVTLSGIRYTGQAPSCEGRI